MQGQLPHARKVVLLKQASQGGGSQKPGLMPKWPLNAEDSRW